MMTIDQVATATLEQLTDELAAAGWDSCEDSIEAARESVLRLLAGSTGKKIRRNADGHQNIADLRRLMEGFHNGTRRVHRLGGNWITSALVRGCWIETTCPYHWNERQALQSVLFGEVETDAEAAYHVNRCRGR